MPEEQNTYGTWQNTNAPVPEQAFGAAPDFGVAPNLGASQSFGAVADCDSSQAFGVTAFDATQDQQSVSGWDSAQDQQYYSDYAQPYQYADSYSFEHFDEEGYESSYADSYSASPDCGTSSDYGYATSSASQTQILQPVSPSETVSFKPIDISKTSAMQAVDTIRETRIQTDHYVSKGAYRPATVLSSAKGGKGAKGAKTENRVTSETKRLTKGLAKKKKRTVWRYLGMALGFTGAFVFVMLVSLVWVGVTGINTQTKSSTTASIETMVAMGLMNESVYDENYFEGEDYTMIAEDSADQVISLRHVYPVIKEETLAKQGFTVPSALAQEEWKEIEYRSPVKVAERASEEAQHAAKIAAIEAAVEHGLSELHWANVKLQIEELLGIPYVWGGKTKRGWDCSGFVSYTLKYIYKTSCSAGIGTYGLDAYCKKALVFTGTSAEEYDNAFAEGIIKPGDIVMFYYRKNATLSVHVAIAGEDAMLYHAWNENYGTVYMSFDFVWKIDNAYTGVKSRSYASYNVYRGLS